MHALPFNDKLTGSCQVEGGPLLCMRTAAPAPLHVGVDQGERGGRTHYPHTRVRACTPPIHL